ncbi:hypothetical protein F5984_17625 [Rudanella paleaurantiibacter]|uniref:Heavy metal-binding domain-containing protein n=1 Tax=Rudanella paleaurantiibacter TaxID=2614655 RepID=A0A7J5TW42_9BACT|nr:hypothetical protein [Rudanella paleaurantiibacter]KAB7728657.1 hypothetical protein F5984_17625 [Rudanella paleaurantiibacter]
MLRWIFLLGGLLFSLTGCFRPAIPISTGPKYPIDVFYENERPYRPYDVVQEMESRQELPLDRRQNQDGRMLSRGNTMQDKELLLAKMTLEAQRAGADALINVKYTYYTTATVNGYLLSGQAVKYRPEN